MDRDLFEAALQVRNRAHAPYSGFPVGAAIRTAFGVTHVGCNVENAAFPEGWCAETSAIARMVAAMDPEDGGRRIDAVCVVAEAIDGRPVPPCGGCRQRIAEFGHADTLIHCYDPAGNGATWRLGELLPQAFSLNGGS